MWCAGWGHMCSEGGGGLERGGGKWGSWHSPERQKGKGHAVTISTSRSKGGLKASESEGGMNNALRPPECELTGKGK